MLFFSSFLLPWLLWVGDGVWKVCEPRLLKTETQCVVSLGPAEGNPFLAFLILLSGHVSNDSAIGHGGCGVSVFMPV